MAMRSPFEELPPLEQATFVVLAVYAALTLLILANMFARFTGG